MHQPDHTPPDDIAKQNYKGPSALKAAAGEGVVAHFQWAAIGLVGGGLLAYVLHKPLEPMIERIRKGSHALRSTGHGFKDTLGKIGGFMFGYGAHAKLTPEKIKAIEVNREHGFGLTLFSHTFGRIPSVKKWLDEALAASVPGKVDRADRVAMAFTGGGIFAFFGYFVLPVILGLRGAKRGNQGKRQFEQAKDEIWDLRAENDQLRHRNLDLKTQVNDLQTINPEQSKLRIAPDEPPVIQNESNPQLPLTQATEQDAKKPEAATPQVEKKSAVDLESPGSVETPRIEAPAPAAPPVVTKDAVDLESPGSVETPTIEPAKPAAPPVAKDAADASAPKTSHVDAAAKTDRPKDWKQAVARDEESNLALAN